jgi:hypothetical protein
MYPFPCNLMMLLRINQTGQAACQLTRCVAVRVCTWVSPCHGLSEDVLHVLVAFNLRHGPQWARDHLPTNPLHVLVAFNLRHGPQWARDHLPTNPGSRNPWIRIASILEQKPHFSGGKSLPPPCAMVLACDQARSGP